LEHANEHAPSFWDFDNSLRDSTIRTLMDDLDRTMRSLECDIAAEEERAGIFDRADVAYPVLAVALATRRDNLKVTIASLGKGLATIGDGHPDNKLDRLERAS
jgi:hypothetical protein